MVKTTASAVAAEGGEALQADVAVDAGASATEAVVILSGEISRKRPAGSVTASVILGP